MDEVGDQRGEAETDQKERIRALNAIRFYRAQAAELFRRGSAEQYAEAMALLERAERGETQP